jgi:hypothetical protein
MSSVDVFDGFGFGFDAMRAKAYMLIGLAECHACDEVLPGTWFAAAAQVMADPGCLADVDCQKVLRRLALVLATRDKVSSDKMMRAQHLHLLAEVCLLKCMSLQDACLLLEKLNEHEHQVSAEWLRRFVAEKPDMCLSWELFQVLRHRPRIEDAESVMGILLAQRLPLHAPRGDGEIQAQGEHPLCLWFFHMTQWLLQVMVRTSTASRRLWLSIVCQFASHAPFVSGCAGVQGSAMWFSGVHSMVSILQIGLQRGRLCAATSWDALCAMLSFLSSVYQTGRFSRSMSPPPAACVVRTLTDFVVLCVERGCSTDRGNSNILETLTVTLTWWAQLVSPFDAELSPPDAKEPQYELKELEAMLVRVQALWPLEDLHAVIDSVFMTMALHWLKAEGDLLPEMTQWLLRVHQRFHKHSFTLPDALRPARAVMIDHCLSRLGDHLDQTVQQWEVVALLVEVLECAWLKGVSMCTAHTHMQKVFAYCIQTCVQSQLEDDVKRQNHCMACINIVCTMLLTKRTMMCDEGFVATFKTTQCSALMKWALSVFQARSWAIPHATACLSCLVCFVDTDSALLHETLEAAKIVWENMAPSSFSWLVTFMRNAFAPDLCRTLRGLATPVTATVCNTLGAYFARLLPGKLFDVLAEPRFSNMVARQELLNEFFCFVWNYFARVSSGAAVLHESICTALLVCVQEVLAHRLCILESVRAVAGLATRSVCDRFRGTPGIWKVLHAQVSRMILAVLPSLNGKTDGFAVTFAEVQRWLEAVCSANNRALLASQWETVQDIQALVQCVLAMWDLGQIQATVSFMALLRFVLQAHASDWTPLLHATPVLAKWLALHHRDSGTHQAVMIRQHFAAIMQLEKPFLRRWTTLREAWCSAVARAPVFREHAGSLQEQSFL